MPLDLANLAISRIMVHVVHPRDVNKRIVQPNYSAGYTTLGEQGLGALRTRVVNALGSDSHGVEMAIVKNDSGSFFYLAARLINANNKVFKTLSQHVADKLAEAQASRRLPGGAVVVMDGTVGITNRRYLCVIKAETHEGFHNKSKAGAITMEYISNLLLTPQQKLYKIGLFIENKRHREKRSEWEASDFSAYVFDHNMTQKETRSAAHYFYNSFLGCDIPESAGKNTRDYFQHTRSFINNADLDSETKIDLYNSLYTYLKVDQKNVISVKYFSTTYLQADLRDSYVKYMIKNGVPEGNITKDLSYIKNALRRRKVNFSSSIQITGPADTFNELVTVTGSTGDATTVRIKGTVSSQQ